VLQARGAVAAGRVEAAEAAGADAREAGGAERTGAAAGAKAYDESHECREEDPLDVVQKRHDKARLVGNADHVHAGQVFDALCGEACARVSRCRETHPQKEALTKKWLSVGRKK
jgi:hypothetical protein